MQYSVIVVYVALGALLFWGSKFARKGTWNEDYLGYDQTKYIQGFLAVCIMLHHIGQEMCATWQYYPVEKGLGFFVPLGPEFVGVFMLFSGYGLYVSWQKKPDYLGKGFFRRRVLPLIIGYYASAWIFLIARFAMGQRFDNWTLSCLIDGIMLSNPYGWFAFAMPFFYLFFYISFKYFKKRPILGVFLFILAYTFAGTCIDHNNYLMTGQWWWNCVHMFWIGLLLAKYRDGIIAWAKKGWLIKLVLTVVLFHAFWYLSDWCQSRFSYYGENWGAPKRITVLYRWITLVSEQLYIAFFSFIILMLGLKITIGNRMLAFMSTITFEFYIIHGLTIEFFSFRFCDAVKPLTRITNCALMTLIVFAAGIPLALGMKKICHMFDPKKKQKV